jgi:hypothetical protein
MPAFLIHFSLTISRAFISLALAGLPAIKLIFCYLYPLCQFDYITKYSIIVDQ